MNRYSFGMAFAVLATAIPAAAPAQRAGPAVIVIVDTERVYRECNACKAAQSQLQTQATSLQQRAQALSAPIQTEAQAIQTAVNALQGKQPDAALTARIQALQTKQNTANQELQGREQTLRSTQAHILQQINTRLNPIITQVMTAQGANIAVDENNTLAHGASLDVTNAVLASLNQQLPSVSVTPLPQAQQTQQPQGR